MNGEAIAWLSALELRGLYRSRELSPVEVAEATLARIEALDPTLAAFVTRTPERALAEARRSERSYVAGHAERPLEGIPISLKDLVPTRGVRTTRGSLLYEDWVPDFDAPVAERVRDAGAVMLGKTNTPEMGWKGDSGNRVLGPTHNPFEHGRTAGGSSGGAAAAMAAGLGPLAQGSDGAGSIRIPAAFCGVFGHKPSFGLVPLLTPTLPVTAFAAGDDHPGPIGDRPASVLGWTCFTYPFNVTGHPAATVPAGLAPDGLPVGLQIVGGWREDATVLRAAAAYEEVRPWLESLASAVERLTPK